MELRRILMEALADSDPKEFNRLSRSNQLEPWIQAKGKAAMELFDQLTKDQPKTQDGVVRDPQARRTAEETVIAQMVEGITSSEPSPTEPATT